MNPTFADFYTPAIHAAVIDHQLRHPPSGPKGQVEYDSEPYKAWMAEYRIHADVVEAATGAFILATSEHSPLQKFEFSEGRGLRFCDAWDRLVSLKLGDSVPGWRRNKVYETDDKISDLQEVARHLTRGPTSRARALGHERERIIAECAGVDLASEAARASLTKVMATVSPTEVELAQGETLFQTRCRKVYEEIVAKMDSGCFAYYDFESDGMRCQVTGVRFSVELDHWKPVLGTVDYNMRPVRREDRFERVSTGLPKPEVLHQVIPAPSGTILVADWFRIPGFSAAVSGKTGDRNADAKSHISIESDAGKAAQTAQYAQKYGFASIFVGNTSPAVVNLGDGRFVIGDPCEDARSFKSLDAECKANGVDAFAGRTCTDLWWVTAIDKEILTLLVARGSHPGVQPDDRDYAAGCSYAAAKKQVNDYVREHKGDIVILKVSKDSDLHLYHTANDLDMDKFESPELAEIIDANAVGLAGGPEENPYDDEDDAPRPCFSPVYGVLSRKGLTWQLKSPLTPGPAVIPENAEAMAGDEGPAKNRTKP